MRSFNGRKYISLSENSTIEEVGDIGEVADAEVVCDESGSLRKIKAEIIG